MNKSRHIPLIVAALVGVALVALVTTALALAARGSGTHGSVSQAPVQATGMHSAGTVEPPAAMPNLKTLIQKGTTRGSAVVGSFYGRQGQLWISFSCLGAGTAIVSYQPVGSVDIPCSDAAVNATKNQIYFPNDHQIDLHVSAPTTVEWAVLVQQ
jgi:hypothetical protein